MNKYLCLIGLLVLPLSLYGKQRAMTLEDIARIQSVVSVVASPNGEHVAFIKRVPREPYIDDDGEAWLELHIVSLNGDTRPFVTGKVNVSSVQWSDDGKTIYYLAKRGEDKFTSLYSIPVDGGESRRLLSVDSDIKRYSLNKAGDQLVFLAEQEEPKYIKKLEKKGFKAKVYEEELRFTHVWLVSLHDEKPQPKQLNIKGHFSFVQFNPVGDALLLMRSPTPLVDDAYTQKRLLIADLKGKVIAEYKSEGKLSGSAVWSPDGQQVAFLAANDVNDPTNGALYIGQTNGRFQKVVENTDSHIMDVKWSGDRLYYIEHNSVESRVVVRNTKSLQDEQVYLDYGHGVQNHLSVSNNGQVFALQSTPRSPYEVYAVSDNKSQRLSNSNPWLAHIQQPKQEAFRYKARDGLALEGILVYPLNYKKGKRYPMIALIHGGPESHRSNGWNTTYSWPIQVASAQGYFSFIPNYRGSTGRGLAFSKLDQHAYADPEFTDILDGKLALVEQGLVDTNRVGISGGSYGGYATAWSATALSEHYAAGVMFVGISNQLSKFGTTDIPYEMYQVHARAWPWDDYQWMLERSPIYHVKKAKTPLLILHGDSDTRVHPSQSMELYRYLKVLNQAPVRLVLYPGEGHGNKKAAAQLDYSKRFMRWMNYYLQENKSGIPDYDLQHQDKLGKQDED